VDEGALEVAGLVAAARGGGRSPVVWAGSAGLTERVGAFFEPGVLRAVANPRPSAERENLVPLRRYLDGLIERLVERGAARQLAPIGFGRAIAELARAAQLRVVGVDLGARYATWASADESGIAETRVVALGGLASPSLTAPGGPARIAHSLPLAIDELAVADTLQNLRARPGSIPQTDEELAVVHGAARDLLADLAANGPQPEGVDLLIGSRSHDRQRAAARSGDAASARRDPADRDRPGRHRPCGSACAAWRAARRRDRGGARDAA